MKHYYRLLFSVFDYYPGACSFRISLFPDQGGNKDSDRKLFRNEHLSFNNDVWRAAKGAYSAGERGFAASLADIGNALPENCTVLEEFGAYRPEAASFQDELLAWLSARPIDY